MLHVNVGPSALALGLLVPVTLEAGFDVCIIGKPGDRSPRQFGISGSGPGGRLRFRQVDWFLGPATVEDLPADLLARIESDEPMLLSASLREHISSRVPFIVELLRRRPAAAETIVLACENAPHPDYEQVHKACVETGAVMARTVVNRMCLTLDDDSEGKRMVSAHPLGEWLVAAPDGETPSVILAALGTVAEFETVSDIEARHDRKLWMVNGAHQGLALMARRANDDGRLEDGDDLRKALEDPDVRARLGHIHDAMNEALQIVHPELDGNADYGLRHVAAYAEHPDSVARVLKAFRRLDLTPFLDALDERVAAPARVAHENGLSVDAFAHVMDVFLELVANIDAFEDNIELRSTPIPLEADILVVERFRGVLSDWAGDSVDKQTGHFARLLADHREAFEP